MQGGTASSSTDHADALIELIDQLVGELRPGARAHAALDSALERELGLDSLARVELLARVERAFGVRLPAEVLGSAETPRDLLAAIDAALPNRGIARLAEQGRRARPQAAEGLPENARTLVEVLDWHLARHPDRAHVTFYCRPDETESLTYGELAGSAAHVAGGLARVGVERGQCVAMMLPSGLDFFRCFFGILFAGAIPVPMYPPARASQIEDHLRRQAGILRNCGATVLITFGAVRPLAGVLTGLAPELRRVIVAAELCAGRPASRLPVREDDFALFQYTSGSTGAPKGVTLTHRNVLANVRAWGRAAAIDSTDVGVSWLPLYHDMGLIGAWLGSLYHAFPLVLMSPLDFLARPESWLWAIHRHRGTITAAPNFAFDLCVRRLAGQSLEGLDLSSWRMAANGAEPVNPDTMARFSDAFARYGLRAEALLPVYGLAECTVGLTVPPLERGVRVDRVAREAFMLHAQATPADPADPHALRFVSCGRPLAGHEVRIVDDDGNALPERRVGNLEFRGPSATAGYFRNAQATAALFRDGWLVSGDYAYLADGELFITGRSKDLIIRAGRNFYPYDLEQAIGDLNGIRKGCVAVFGVREPDAAIEQLVVLAETRVRDAMARTALERDIAGLATELVGLAPDVVVLAPPHTVLKTSSGKIRRAAIRDAYRAGTLQAGQRAPWRQVASLWLSGLSGRLREAGATTRAYAYGAWVWGWFGLLVSVAAAGILILPGLQRRWRWSHKLSRLFARLCRCRIDVTGLERLPTGPCVLVANHASYVDGFVLAAALPHPVRFVAKAEFMRSRLLRSLFERMGARFVERFDSRQSIEDVGAIAEVAHDPVPLLFFAEGTFSAQAGLRVFRLGAFKIAAECGLPVVPVALAGTRRLLRAESWLPRRGTATVSIGEPVRSGGGEWRDVLVLRDAVRRAILEHCGEPDLEQG
ncbi:MAG TPA: AMP-binding protein [Rhodocyclaceae bacterium]|nr:AMP-binding protein [Rhodocyclaceae bacterium]